MILLMRHIKGGSGATLVSFNLAYEMSRTSSTLFIQMSPYPDLSAYVPINPGSLSREMQKVDTLACMTVSQPISDGELQRQCRDFEWIIIDFDEAMGAQELGKIQEICTCECVISTVDPASIEKISQLMDKPNRIFILNQIEHSVTFREVTAQIPQSRVIGMIPKSADDIIYQISHKIPFQKRPRGRLRKAVSTLSERLVHMLTPRS